MSTMDYESRKAAHDPPAPRSVFVWVRWIALLVLGIQFWLLSDPWLVRPLVAVVALGASIALSFVYPVQRLVDGLNYITARRGAAHTFAVFAMVSLASFLLIVATNREIGRPLGLVMHDEFSYVLQARILAEGRFWMPAHPLGDFFDTFYVITDRAYASQYFPGAAFFLLPGVVLSLPYWFMPSLVIGMACGMFFLVLRELFDGSAGLAGATIVLSTPCIWFVSTLSIAQPPAMFLAMALVYATLRWDTTRKPTPVIVAGAIVGLFAITRPLDALAFAIPAAAFAAWRMRRQPWVEWRRLAVAGVVPIVPFLVLQLVINHGVTGRWLQTPFDYYAQRDMPGSTLGMHTFDPTTRPVSPIAAKQAFYDNFVGPSAKKHTWGAIVGRWQWTRIKSVTLETFADMPLAIFVPFAVLALRDSRQWLVLAATPVWVVLHSFYPFTFFHYYAVLVPVTTLLALAAYDGLFTPWRSQRADAARRALRCLFPITVAVLTLPFFRHDVPDQILMSNRGREAIESLAATAPEPRIVILVHVDVRTAGVEAEFEVVANSDTAWPDDARVIYAHDLGVRNVEMYRYYANIQPDRVAYRFEQGTSTLTRLGTVAELSKVSPADTTRPSMETDR